MVILLYNGNSFLFQSPTSPQAVRRHACIAAGSWNKFIPMI